MIKKNKSFVIWFTGLSGSGKTTLSNALTKKLEHLDYKINIVDGDLFRKKNRNINNFTKKNIINNNIKIIKYVEKIYKKADFTIVSVISPLKKTRLIAKKTFKEKYIEIFVKCSLKKLIQRDTKKLYKLAKEKKITNLIGYKSNIFYEKSNYEKIIVDTEKLDKKKCLIKIINFLNKKKNAQI